MAYSVIDVVTPNTTAGPFGIFDIFIMICAVCLSSFSICKYVNILDESSIY